MSVKNLFVFFQLRLFRTSTARVSSNYISKTLLGYSRRTFAHEHIHNVRNASKSTEENLIDYRLNLPDLKTFSSLAKDAATERKIKVILMEHALARMSGENVPRSLSIVDMDELLQCKTACERIDLLDLFYIRETRKKLLKLKRSIEGTTEWEKNRRFLQYSYEASDHIRYSVDHNCLHVLMDYASIQRFYDLRLAQAACFGQPLVFDFGYDKFMTRRQCSETAKFIYEAYNENRNSREPFDLHFTNYLPSHPEYSVVSETDKQFSSRYGAHAMITLCAKSYLEIFPSKKCIYLTPHADQDMGVFDHDAVYIIGALMTADSSKPLLLNKAKQDGVQTLRIPVEKFSKYYPNRRMQLNFSVMMRVLLEMKMCSFKDSMKKILTSPDEYSMEYEKQVESQFRYRRSRFKFITKDYW